LTRIKDGEYFLAHTGGMWNKAGTVAIAVVLGAGTATWVRSGRATGDETRRLTVTGTVVVLSEGRAVRVAHDAIPGYMPAMTMEFTLAEGESTRQLAPGNRVRLTLRVGREGSRAEGVTVTGQASSPATQAIVPTRVARLKRGDVVPAIALIDEQGRPFTDRDFQGHATVVTFIFTRCPIPEFCPAVVSRFKELQAALARDPSLPQDARLLGITLDPAFDTPAVLKDYARAVGADPARWRFAGGDPPDVLRVAREFSVHVEENRVLLDHTLATALIDAHGRVVEIWRGNGWKASDVLAALRAEGEN
jgi:protein SCO1